MPRLEALAQAKLTLAGWIAGIAALVCSGIGAVALLIAYGFPKGVSFFHDNFFVTFSGGKAVAVLFLGASFLLLTLAMRTVKRLD